jgi:Fe-S-cluster formation regulator IscX/YfhJ
MMNFAEQGQFVESYLKENPNVTKKLTEMFGEGFWEVFNYSIIRRISENRRLFNLYSRQKFNKYFDMAEAMYDSIEGDKILISFTDLKLYANITSIEEFNDFTKNASDLLDEGNNVNLNQILLSDRKQKIIFVSSGDSAGIVEKIRIYVRNYLKSDISVLKTDINTQITIEDFAENYDAVRIKFIDLQDHIGEKDMDLAKMLNLLPRNRKYSYKFIEANINDCLRLDSVDKLIKMFKTPVGPVIINLGHMVIGGTQVNYNNIDNAQTTQKWIIDNPPKNGEPSADYYAKYKLAFPNGVYVREFNKAVEQRGYKKLHGKVNYWNKKK